MIVASLTRWSWSLDGWIVVVGALAAAACAIPGSLLLLRRMSLMGDAISHAVLPGIAAAFLLTGNRASLPMFLGAAMVGALTALASEWLRARGRVEENASIGVVFTSLFALGILLMVRGSARVDLDPSCVLFGGIEFTPLDLVSIGGVVVPRAVLTIGGVLVLNVICVVAFCKELALSIFDPQSAASLGLRPRLLQAMVMMMTAITAVACFESVGSILVVALLVVPAATARLLTLRLSAMVIVAVLVGAVAAATGHMAAVVVPALLGAGSVNTAGSIAVMAGALLVLVILTRRPRRGVRLEWRGARRAVHSS